MKYCSRCGRELHDEAIICPGCGSACDPAMNAAFGYTDKKDKTSVGLCILAFFIPLFGIIYWAIKRTEAPKRAKAVLITALVSYGINFIYIISGYLYTGSLDFMNYLI